LIVPKIKAAKTTKTRRRPPTDIETPKQGFIPGIEDDDDDDSVKEEEEETYGREEEEASIGTVPLLGEGRHFLYTQYGIRKDGEQLMIGDSPVSIDTVQRDGGVMGTIDS